MLADQDTDHVAVNGIDGKISFVADLAAGVVALLPAWAVVKLSDASARPFTLGGYGLAGVGWLLFAGVLWTRLKG